jgi:hypothetical protein
MSTEGQLSVRGNRTSGASVRSQNVMAATSIANIVKSSLGPVGLDKMLVDDVGVRFMFDLRPKSVMLPCAKQCLTHANILASHCLIVYNKYIRLRRM